MSDIVSSSLSDRFEDDAVPIGWKKVSLSEVAEIRVSNVDKKSVDGEIPVRLCNYVDVYKNDYVRSHLNFMEATVTLSELARFRIEQGDVMITKDSETPDDIGVPAVAIWSSPNLVCGYHLALLKLNRGLVDHIFLAKQLRLPRIAAYYGRLACGSTRYGLANAGIARTPVQLPPLPQQRKIARILTTVDNLIEKTEALIAKYQAIKQGMMHDLFTRGVDEHGQLRPTYEEAPELYKQSELGWIPKEWEVGALGEFLISIDAGWSPDCIEQPPTLGEWGVLKVSAVSSGEYVAAESKTLPNHLHPDKSMEVRAGDVLLARSNGVAELVGVTVRVEETQDKLMLSDKVLRLNPDRKRLSQAFLALTMKTEPIRRQVGQVINGSSGQRNISQAEIRKLVFVVPSVQEQQIISSRLQSAQSKIQREVNVVAHLQQVKTGLMQDLLTGKVRVKPDDIEEAARV